MSPNKLIVVIITIGLVSSALIAYLLSQSNSTPSSTVPPVGCYYQEVQCVQAPCDPVLVCPNETTPTPAPPTRSVTITSPRPDTNITNPVRVIGELPLSWLAENCFLIGLKDKNRQDISSSMVGNSSSCAAPEMCNDQTGICQFDIQINYSSTSEPVYIYISSDPMLYPKKEFYFSLKSTNECQIGGCGGQLCVEPGNDMVTTCEYRAEYACYKLTTCERQPDGQCGWTPNPEFSACLQSPPSP